jgi:hypothetical protein
MAKPVDAEINRMNIGELRAKVKALQQELNSLKNSLQSQIADLSERVERLEQGKPPADRPLG